MESLAQAQKNYGKEMPQVRVDEGFYLEHGNKYENLLDESSRITSDEIEQATVEREDLDKFVKQ